MGIDSQMLVKTRMDLTPQAVRAMAVDLAEAFGPDRFWIWEDWDNEDGTRGRHALQIVKEFTQDGESIFPWPGETLIECSISTRYYGDGYERGDIGLVCNVAAWIEQRISDARIFYGGDSSGVCAEPFDAAARAAIFSHFCRVGHKPYRGGFSFLDANSKVSCGFCAIPMTSTGGGGDRTFFYCGGCAKKAVAMKDGRVLIVPKGKDFFDMRDQVPA